MAMEQVLKREHPGTGTTRSAGSEARKAKTIPRPLVQANRLFLVLTIGVALIVHEALLIIPLLTGITSLIFRWNPVIVFGKRFLRRRPSDYRREDPLDQRFNQTLATGLLGLAVVSFALGAPVVGYIASGMVILAAGVALLGFCVGCYIRFRIRQWKHTRNQPSVPS
ncbi:MAG TPA: DUF4395 domain-containing protein [bacterium]|nr:DUF4395 domain-containing protein [bacterium]